MVAEGYRARVQPYVRRMSEPFLGWSPALLSAVALGLAVGAALLAAATRWLGALPFLGVAVLIFLSGVFDVIDGEVARRTGAASARGDLLDHVFDRYADVALLLGLAASGFALPLLALLALVSLLLPSYMGTQAQALGAPRLYAGLLSRADRLLLLALVTFLEFDLSLPWPWAPTAPFAHFGLAGVSFTVIDVGLAYFVIAGQVTAVMRARTVYRALPPAPAPRGPSPP